MKIICIISITILFCANIYAQTTGTINCPITVAIDIPANAINTVHLMDGAVTQSKILSGQVVRSINGLKDDITLLAGPNVTITPSGNTFTISSTGGGTGGGAGFWNVNGNHISNNNNGNVGIGITNPDSRLHIGGDIHLEEPGGIFFNRGPSDPNYYLKPYSAPNEWGMRLNGFSGVRLSTGQGDILNVFQHNVGIGTTNPEYKLDVLGGNIRTDGNLLFNETGQLNARQHAIIHQHSNGSSENNFIAFLVSDGSGINGERMRINGAGSVAIGTSSPGPGSLIHVGNENPFVFTTTGQAGIGTTAPLGRLHVKTKGTSMMEGLVIENPQANGMILSMHQGIPGQLNFSKLGSPIEDLLTLDFARPLWGDGVYHPEPLKRGLQPSFIGAVGIGTSSPKYRLHIIGTLNVDGEVFFRGVHVPSDAHLKTKIEPIVNSIKKLQAIRGVTYLWKSDEYPQMGLPVDSQLGVIAQDVEAVLPEIISVNADGYKTVEYMKLIPVLIEAIKEQQQEIDQLHALLDHIVNDRK